MFLSDQFGDKSKPIAGVDYDMIYPKNYALQKPQVANAIGIFPQNIKLLPSGKLIINDLHSIEYSAIEDLHDIASKTIKEGNHSSILIYYGNLDHTEHMHGYLSDESLSEAAKIVKLIDDLYTVARDSGYDLIVTADHGHVIVKDPEFKVFDSTSELSKLMERPSWGNARTMFIQSKKGEEEKLEYLFNEEFGDYGALFRSEDVIAAGIFGSKKPLKEKRENFGTHIVFSKGNYSINYTANGQYDPWFDRPTGQIGTHGGMSASEIQVPLILFEH